MEFPFQSGKVCLCFGLSDTAHCPCRHSGLPDTKYIWHKRSSVTASTRSGSTERTEHSKTWVKIGVVFEIWRQPRAQKDEECPSNKKHLYHNNPCLFNRIIAVRFCCDGDPGTHTLWKECRRYCKRLPTPPSSHCERRMRECAKESVRGAAGLW